MTFVLLAQLRLVSVVVSTTGLAETVGMVM